jgi:hypothetical protein
VRTERKNTRITIVQRDEKREQNDKAQNTSSHPTLLVFSVGRDEEATPAWSGVLDVHGARAMDGVGLVDWGRGLDLGNDEDRLWLLLLVTVEHIDPGQEFQAYSYESS